MQELKNKILDRLKITDADELDDSITLNKILSLSPTAVNSIDIMEAFAGAITDLGYENELDLPAFTLDAKLEDVMKEILGQLQKEKDVTQ